MQWMKALPKGPLYLGLFFVALGSLFFVDQEIVATFMSPPSAIGQIVVAEGGVIAVTPDSTLHPLVTGSYIYAEETIQVDVDARAQIKLADGSLINLIPDSEYVVDTFRHNQLFRKSRCVSSLFKGGLRVLSGSIGTTDPEDYQVKTPTATIGLRGTLFDARLEEANLYVSVEEGAVRVHNAVGSLYVAQGQSTSVARTMRPELLFSRPAVMNPILFTAPRGGLSLQAGGRKGLFAQKGAPPRRLPAAKPAQPKAGGAGGAVHKEVHPGGAGAHPHGEGVAPGGAGAHPHGEGVTPGGAGAHPSGAAGGGHGGGLTGGAAGGAAGGTTGSPGR